ncbi:hypothetical protein IJG14_03115 [bacterium]|nr:hypothetical protein [bacterium]
MGMAASQARFLGLTARKSNTEYEGQQVNQQRTALANESASLYSKLTNLTVPTPPDITNYYKTEYTFSYNGDTYTFSSLPVKGSDGYTISVSKTTQKAGYRAVDMEDLGFDPKGKTPSSIALSTRPNLIDFLNASLDEKNQIDKSTDKVANVYSNNDNWYYEVDGQYYQYVPTDVVQDFIYSGASIEFNESGDFSTLSCPALTGNNKVSISTTTVADDEAYDLAMNEYKKEYNEYEKTMAAINAKTEVIQQQDKTLELRLNQLDTEQNAISTEMDAVQKVIEKNVESTFKTFA